MGGDHIDPWATPVVAVESSDGTGKGTAKGTAKLSKLSTKGATKGARDVVLPRTISRPWLKLDGSQNRSLLKRFDHGAVWVVVTLPYTVGRGRVGGTRGLAPCGSLWTPVAPCGDCGLLAVMAAVANCVNGNFIEALFAGQGAAGECCGAYIIRLCVPHIFNRDRLVRITNIEPNHLQNEVISDAM